MGPVQAWNWWEPIDSRNLPTMRANNREPLEALKFERGLRAAQREQVVYRLIPCIDVGSCRLVDNLCHWPVHWSGGCVVLQGNRLLGWVGIMAAMFEPTAHDPTPYTGPHVDDQ